MKDINKKTAVLKKLRALNVTNEKSLQALELDAIIESKNITMSDLKIIIEIKKAAKNNKLFSYFMEEDNDEERIIGDTAHN